MSSRKLKKRLTEDKVQEVLESHYRGLGYTVIREYKVGVGIIDLLYMGEDRLGRGVKSIVEVKERSAIKHAIGQIETYRKYIPNVTKLEIIYFDYDGKHRGISPIYRTFEHIEIKSVHTVVDTRLLHIKDDVLINIKDTLEKVDEEEIWQNTLLREQDNMIQELYQSIELSGVQEEQRSILDGQILDNFTF